MENPWKIHGISLQQFGRHRDLAIDEFRTF